MSRILVVIAALIVVMAVGVTIWMSSRSPEVPVSSGAGTAPPQFDTTGGQDMRPRWNNGGGQDDDAADN